MREGVDAERGRLVVLDRDGVINEDSDAYIKSVAEWRPIPGSLEAIAALTRAGYSVAVVTNQSGVGRGLLSEDTLAAIHEHMLSRVRAVGGEVAGIFYCPHTPEAGCDCRKPKPGLFKALERKLGVSVRGVAYVGDKPSDVEAARAAGARPILVRTGRGALAAEAGIPAGVPVFDDLLNAAHAIIAEAVE